MRCALLFIRSLYPHSPLVGLSFSLGANVLAKYLGEEGDGTPLLAGIACAAPYHLKRGSDLLEESFFRRMTYSKAMNGNLTRVARKHAATLDLDETLRDPLDDLLDAKRAQARTKKRGEDVANSKDTLKFVDDTLVRLVGGHKKPYGEFPFNSADDYYRHGGALNALKGLRRPLLALNSDDDPIVASEGVAGIRHLMGWHDSKEEEDFGHTEFIALATTHGGGHLGWWQGYKKQERWVHLPVVDFSKAVFEHSKRLVESKASHPTSNDAKQPTAKKEVLVELMPSEVLPSYIEVRDRGSQAKKEAIDKLDKRFNHGPRLPWLRTHLLQEAVLVHPSMSRHGWCGQEPASQADFALSKEGGLDVQDEAKAEGWCAFTGHMTCDSTRPEVGYLELPAWTRVAGSGEDFQGGKDVPGLYGEKVASSDGTIAGL
jgi:predicted alpha/beta-fold hydrolase